MILAIIFAILNALRGSGFWKDDSPDAKPRIIDYILARPFWMVCMALSVEIDRVYAAVGNLVQFSIVYHFLITFFTLWFGFVFGWGKYLNVAFPNVKYINESEIRAIDWLADKICGKPLNKYAFSRWCFVAFTFRSLLFYPIFVILSLYNTYALFWGMGILFMPVIYWLRRFTPEVYSVRIAEFAFGGLLGFLISHAV